MVINGLIELKMFIYIFFNMLVLKIELLIRSNRNGWIKFNLSMSWKSKEGKLVCLIKRWSCCIVRKLLIVVFDNFILFFLFWWFCCWFFLFIGIDYKECIILFCKRKMRRLISKMICCSI